MYILQRAACITILVFGPTVIRGCDEAVIRPTDGISCIKNGYKKPLYNINKS